MELGSDLWSEGLPRDHRECFGYPERSEFKKQPKGCFFVPAIFLSISYNLKVILLGVDSMRTELVTTLKRQATKLLADVNESKEPILITEHGKPAAYLIDVENYQLMQVRMEILEGIAKGEQAIRDGRVIDNDTAKERMSKWLK